MDVYRFETDLWKCSCQWLSAELLRISAITHWDSDVRLIFILFLDLRAGIQQWRRNHYHSALIEQKPAEPWSSNKLSFPSVWACDRYSGFTISLRAQRSSSSHLTLFLYSSEFFGPPSSGDKRDIFLHSFCFCKVQIVWEHWAMSETSLRTFDASQVFERRRVHVKHGWC